MEHKTQTGHERLFSLLAFMLVITLIGGCAAGRVETQPEGAPPEKPPATMEDYGFKAIRVGQGDTLSSLAKQYLDDASMDWFIAEFNGITAITPGQELIIPLKPYDKGGLSLRGYQTVPVLNYHQFSETLSNKMTVTRAAFEEQMKFLKDNGYHVITMDELLDFLDFKKQVPKKSVVITIDDGWRSMYDIAFPILKAYGYPATLFVYTDLITGSYKTLSWDLIQKMAESGIDIQCHTKSHRNLTTPDASKKEAFREYFEAIEKELSGCMSLVKKKLNKDVKYTAYPFGETNHLVIEVAKKVGYRGAFTTKRGGNPFFVHNYRINRSMIYGEFNLSNFEKNLSPFTEEALQ